MTKKVRKALQRMELDIEENYGLYPFNGGRLTNAEVCRRAGISKMTLHSPSHKETTRRLVEAWVVNASLGSIQGVKSIRRAVTDRAQEWKRAHAELATRLHIDHLQLVNAQVELAAAMARIQELESINAALLEDIRLAGRSMGRALPNGRSD